SASTATATGLSAGSYTVTITDDNGCTDTETVSITEPGLLVASIIFEVDVNCAGDSTGMAVATALGGATPYSYAWPSGFLAANDTLSGLPAGLYTVTVTDANGCSDTSTALIQQNTNLSISLDSIAGANCVESSDGFAQVTAGGGVSPYAYSWPVGGTSSSNSTLPIGNHCVTITDAVGCFDTLCFTINAINPSPEINLGNDTSLCGNTFILDAGSASGYLWSSGGNGQLDTVSANGVYSVTIADSNGCTSADTINVMFFPSINFNITTDSSACGSPTGSAFITINSGGGGYEFLWSTGQIGNDTLDSLLPGMYGVTVSDSNGCSTSENFEIYQQSDLELLVEGMDASCFDLSDGEASALVSGGISPYSYVWSTGSNASNLNNLSAGSVALTVTDANGCLAMDSVQINQPDEIMIALSSSDPSCGGSNGWIQVDSVANTQGSYTLLWSDSNASTSAIVDSLSAGYYSVILTDSVGCSAMSGLALSDTNSAILNVTSTNNACSNENTAIAYVEATGVEPLNYLWDDPQAQSTDTAFNLHNGNYVVSVTDSNGCLAVASVEVNSDFNAPIIDLGDDIEACDGEEVILTPGSGFTSYLWSTGDITISLDVSSSQLYQVNVVDSNGCTGSDSVAVQFYEIPVFDLGKDTLVCLEDSITSIVLDAGIGFNIYSWSTGDTTNSIEVSESGLYSVSAGELEGCEGSDQIIVVFDTCVNVSAPRLELPTAPRISVYPNPNRGRFTYTASGLEDGEYDLRIINSMGQQVEFVEFNVENRLDVKSEIDMTSTSRGVYMIIIQGENYRYDGRLIIQ
ncbi:MAG: T9SS type A sorting domain-containing protein, partial [Salibacteraceae bacterium]